MAEIGLVLPLAAAVFAAMANIVAKSLLDDVDFRLFIVLSFVWIFVLMTPLGLLSFELSDLSIAVPLLGLIFALDAAGNYFYFAAMDLQEVSRLSAIAGMGPLFTMVFAAALLPSHLTAGVVVAVVVIVLGVYILNLDGHGLGSPIYHMVDKRNYEAVIGAMLFGLSAIPSRYALTEFAVTNPETLYWLRAFVIGIVLFIVFRPEIRSIGRRTFSIIGGRALLVIGQWMAFLYAIAGTNVVLSVAIARTTPVFTLLFGWLLLDEKVTVRKAVAVGLIVVTVVGLEVSGTFI